MKHFYITTVHPPHTTFDRRFFCRLGILFGKANKLSFATHILLCRCRAVPAGASTRYQPHFSYTLVAAVCVDVRLYGSRCYRTARDILLMEVKATMIRMILFIL